MVERAACIQFATNGMVALLSKDERVTLVQLRDSSMTQEIERLSRCEFWVCGRKSVLLQEKTKTAARAVNVGARCAILAARFSHAQKLLKLVVASMRNISTRYTHFNITIPFHAVKTSKFSGARDRQIIVVLRGCGLMRERARVPLNPKNPISEWKVY